MHTGCGIVYTMPSEDKIAMQVVSVVTYLFNFKL
jgi:hypothetical protein